MKIINSSLAVFFCLFCIHTSKGQTDIDNIACLGNGSMAVYENKADVLQVFGPPYSAPSIMEMKLDPTIQVISEREKGTAIWKHTLLRNNKKIGEITDFVVKGLNCFIRQIKNTAPLTFTIKKPAKNSWIDNNVNYQNKASGAALSKTPAGTFVYSTYPTATEAYHQVLVTGKSRLSEKSPETWQIDAGPGESVLFIIGGPSYPECVKSTKKTLEKSPDVWLAHTRKWWHDFSSRRIDFSKKLPAHFPQRKKLLQTIDDVAVLIKTQQATEGAVLAGHNYHLGYIRDQYGVSRGLLTLGYFAEARSILQFYWDIWHRKGVLHNAQGIGMDAFHIHENDEVEQTGYLIIQAFDYLQKTNDQDFIKEIFPMLSWAWNSQKKNLIKHMLPFNGDETYVAGGILPRTALLDGSAEATLLFITSGDLLLDWIETHEQWAQEMIDQDKKLLQDTKDHYQENFIESGRLLTNNPSRMLGEKYPDFRHGVCESLVAPCEIFGWTQRTANNRYLCPVCFASKTLPKAKPEKFFLQSVSLIPLYIHASILPEEQINAFVKEIVASYKKTGKLPSRPDGNITVGYDYGLFLYSLSSINDPLKEDIYRNMMDVLDETGSWVEYYDDNKPRGTRYRPWESAINLEAAIFFAEQYGNKSL